MSMSTVSREQHSRHEHHLKNEGNRWSANSESSPHGRRCKAKAKAKAGVIGTMKGTKRLIGTKTIKGVEGTEEADSGRGNGAFASRDTGSSTRDKRDVGGDIRKVGLIGPILCKLGGDFSLM